MAKLEVVASRIFTAQDIVNDPIYAEREDIVEIEDADLGTVRMQAVVPKMGSRPGSVWRTGPSLGQDNDLVLGEWLGKSDDELAALRSSGTI
jgi:formyl-CoA transferase